MNVFRPSRALKNVYISALVRVLVITATFLILIAIIPNNYKDKLMEILPFKLRHCQYSLHLQGAFLRPWEPAEQRQHPRLVLYMRPINGIANMKCART